MSGTSLNRVPPQNIDAERAVLGAMLMVEGGKEAIPKVIKILGDNPSSFYKEAHQKIYTAILNLFGRGQPVDLLTVRGELERTGDLEKVGGVSYIDEMIDSVPTAANAGFYAALVREAAERRAYIQKSREIFNLSDDLTVDIEEVREAVQSLSDVSESTKEQPQTTPVSATELIQQEIDEPAMIVSDGILPAFGYSMIAGVTKLGKTSLAIQLALSISAGMPFLGFEIERQVQILYCYLEGTPASISKLIRSQVEGWGCPIDTDRLNMLESRRLSLESERGLRWLRGHVDKTGAELVIIDPIAKALTRDVNRHENIARFVNTMDKLSAESKINVTWLLVHHYGKPTLQKRQPIQQMLGSSGWGNYTESFIGVERYSERRSPDYKRLTFNLRHGPDPGDVCVYLNPETRLFEVVESQDIPSLNAERVRDILSEYGVPASYTRLRTLIEMQLGISEAHAARLVSEAKRAGFIHKGEGRYDKYFTDINMIQDSKKIIKIK